MRKHQFLLEELVKRDFVKKYKRTILGMAWSVLSPLLMLLVMRLVFTRFFGRTMEHYTTFIFSGNLLFAYFRDSTTQGMASLVGNASIFSKVNVPKYLFLFSKNIQALINFALTMVVFLLFCIFDHVAITFHFIWLVYPILCMMIFNIGIGFIVSALFVFFRDMEYLWSVFTQILMYFSAIFYQVDLYPIEIQRLFLLNPVYCYIKFFRIIVLDGTLPSLQFFLLCAAYAIVAFTIGGLVYKKNNTRFLYYI